MEEWHVSWPIKSNLIHPIMISFIKVSRLSSTLQARFTRRCLQREVTRGIYTHKQVRATFQRLVRKKKRLYLAKFEDNLYCLFLGQEVKEHGKCLMRGELPHNWPHLRCGMNTQSFYMISRGNLLFPTHMSHAHMNQLFYSPKCKKCHRSATIW